ncbi:MAG: CotH kinase family protein [Paludibacteraceae bacterium]|nr:CotH kinase family protein [Paludibacteraceae bacterium]
MRYGCHIITLLFCLLAGVTLRAGDFAETALRLNEKSLPILNLSFDESALRATGFIACKVDLRDYHGRLEGGKTAVCYEAQIRHRGGSSLRYEKKSFAIKLKNEQNKKLSAELFGIRKSNSWILDAMAVDRLRMRNRLCFDVWNEISPMPYDTDYGNRNGTNGEFVEVFVNGTYFGLYCLTDKVDRALLGLKKKPKQNPDGASHGYLYKGVSWSGAHSLRGCYMEPTNSDTWLSFEIKYPDNKNTIAHWEPLKNLVDFCSDSVSALKFRLQWKEHFYEDNLIDYFALLMTMNIGDAPYKNTYLSVADYPNDHRFLITPWDMDMSLGGNYDGSYNDTVASLDRLCDVAPYNRLYGEDINGFQGKVHRRIITLQDSVLSPTRLYEQMARYATLFEESGAWKREVERWNNNPVALKADIRGEIGYVSSWYKRNYDNLRTECESRLDSEKRDQRRRLIISIVSLILIVFGISKYKTYLNKNHILL